MTHAESRTRSDIDLRRADRLFARWREHDDVRAREELICLFLPLARRLAARYRSPSEPFEDLVQVASVGMIGAVDRFDRTRGTGFIAFAVPTVLGELKRHFRNTGWDVHVPRRAQELSLRVARADEALTATLGRRPTVPAIAQYLEIGLDEVLRGLDAAHAHHADSLDAPIGGGDELDGSEGLLATLGADDASFDLVETQQSLGAAIRRLPNRERAAVLLRMREGLRQVDIAERLECSQMQVSRLLTRAAQRLRQEAAIG